MPGTPQLIGGKAADESIPFLEPADMAMLSRNQRRRGPTAALDRIHEHHATARIVYYPIISRTDTYLHHNWAMLLLASWALVVSEKAGRVSCR